MIRRWWKNISEFKRTIYYMTWLAWQSQPHVFIALITLQALQGILPLFNAWITKSLFDLLALSVAGNRVIDFASSFIPLLMFQAVLAVTGQGLGSISAYLSSEMGRSLTLKVRATTYGKITTLNDLSYFENPRFHDTLQMASQGGSMGPGQMLNTLTRVLQSVITLVSFLGVLLIFSPLLALIVIVASLPQLLVQLKMGRQRFGLAYTISPKERKGFYLGNILSSVYYAKEVRLFNLGDFFLKQFLRITREVQDTQRQQQIRELRWQFGLGLLSTLVTSGAFAVVVMQAVAGQITLGDVTLYTGALGSVQGALSGLIYAFASLNESALFFSRYQELMALPPALKISQSPCAVPPLRESIELRGVSFRYTDDHPWVLKDVNLTLPAGECLALVGLNGAGKTTLVKLLTRLYDPSEGQILWDGIDIREFDPVELRQHMGAIFQDFVRFDLTAQENIGLGNVEKMDDLAQIEQSARAVGIHDTIEKLPGGYQAVLSRWLVEEGQGVDLSDGQWQKIATARMLMREAELLILDEPTAALDAEAEYEIYSQFTNLVRGRTSLLISHRFSTVRIADVIAVLENGRIIEYGSHADLMALGKTYARLYTMQAEQYA